MEPKPVLEIKMVFADEEITIKGEYRDTEYEMDLIVRFLRAEGLSKRTIIKMLEDAEEGLRKEIRDEFYQSN